MLFTLLTVCNSLPLVVNGKDFLVQGTPTVAFFEMESPAVTTWTVLLSSFGDEAMTGLVGVGLTYDQQGIWLVYQATAGSVVTTISITATAKPFFNRAILTLSEAQTSLPAGVSFDLGRDKVFKLCVYPNMGLTNQSSTISPSCGSFHTFSTADSFYSLTSTVSSSSRNSIDRNMGTLSANWTGTGRNSYKFSLYSGIYSDSIFNKTLNFALVVTTTGFTSFEMWAAIGITNKRMVNQDMIMLGKEGSMYDGWSTSRTNSAVSQDSAIGCKNDITSISHSKSVYSGNTYQFWHGSRPFDTKDDNCDLDINTITQLCSVYQDKTTITDFEVDTFGHSTVQCGRFVDAHFNMLRARVLVLAFLYL